MTELLMEAVFLNTNFPDQRPTSIPFGAYYQRDGYTPRVEQQPSVITASRSGISALNDIGLGRSRKLGWRERDSRLAVVIHPGWVHTDMGGPRRHFVEISPNFRALVPDGISSKFMAQP